MDLKNKKNLVKSIKDIIFDSFNEKKVDKKIKHKKKKVLPKLTKLIKPGHNPIISPSYYNWETKATFNPAAFISDGKIHLLYRAIGEDDSSVLGYASSYDGLYIENRPTYAVYKRSNSHVEYNKPPIRYVSGGGWSGGCEDPRITLIGDTVYMLYTAFDGWGSVRIALTSIKLSDFKKKKWNWEKYILISPKGERHKNWALFPEKINGKFAIFHNLHTDDPSRVRVSFFDNLNKKDFAKADFESPDPNALPNKRCGWHDRMRSVGPPPIKTKLGWLVLYHAMDSNDPNRYKLGAMILDLKDPTKVLYRLKNPILEPDEHYENNGNKWGVIYSNGAVIKKGKLFVYYGGSDKYVCVASIKLDELLSAFKEKKTTKLKKLKNFLSFKK